MLGCSPQHAQVRHCNSATRCLHDSLMLHASGRLKCALCPSNIYQVPTGARSSSKFTGKWEIGLGTHLLQVEAMHDIMCPDVDLHIGEVLVQSPHTPVIRSCTTSPLSMNCASLCSASAAAIVRANMVKLQQSDLSGYRDCIQWQGGRNARHAPGVSRVMTAQAACAAPRLCSTALLPASPKYTGRSRAFPACKQSLSHGTGAASAEYRPVSSTVSRTCTCMLLPD